VIETSKTSLVRTLVLPISFSRILEKVAVPASAEARCAALPFHTERFSSRWMRSALAGISRSSALNSEDAWMIRSSTSGAIFCSAFDALALKACAIGTMTWPCHPGPA
jgi:hypothetical protein